MLSIFPITEVDLNITLGTAYRISFHDSAVCCVVGICCNNTRMFQMNTMRKNVKYFPQINFS